MGRSVIYIRPQAAAAYNPLTTAWIAETGETDPTIIGGLNTFEQGLIDNSLTSKFYFIHPYVGGDSTKNSYNFIDTSTYQISFNGGWTHDAFGSKPGGTNSYGNTGLIPNSVMSLNDVHISVYLGTADSSGAGIGVDIGVMQTSPAPTRLLELSGQLGSLGRMFGNDFTATSVGSITDGRGFWMGVRDGATSTVLYRNGSSVATSSTASISLPSYSIFVGARNLNGTYNAPSSKRLQLTTAGVALTAGEEAIFYGLVQALQTTLGRNY